MAEQEGGTKDTLLSELESIKGLLDDEDGIPVLREVIESIQPVDGDQPQQASLFQPPATARGINTPRRRTPATPQRASGENPFLPAHIRARLHGNRPPPGWDTGSHESDTPEPTATHQSRDQLIEQLITEVMPQLESRLRERLEQASDAQLQQWIEPGSSGHQT